MLLTWERVQTLVSAARQRAGFPIHARSAGSLADTQSYEQLVLPTLSAE